MNLLTRSSINYIFFSVVAFVVGGIIFFHVIKTVFYRQIDETLKTEKQLIEGQIDYSDTLPDFRQVFSHMIEVTVFNSPKKKFEFIKDTALYDKSSDKLVPVRQLICENTSIQNQGVHNKYFKTIGRNHPYDQDHCGSPYLAFLFFDRLTHFCELLYFEKYMGPV